MIELSHVSKRYQGKYAVRDISFKTEEGEILGFLGRNGAGKTTTMNMITGYISASEGTITVDGYDVLKNPLEVKQRIGYLPEQPPLYGEMTVDEYIRFVCDIKGVRRDVRKPHVEEIYSLVKLEDVSGRLIKNLSKGYKQRVGLAEALVGNPPAIILDEPTVGLDPMQIVEIRQLIKSLGRKHTVILSSHILSEVADVCQKLVIIRQGEIVAQDTLENLTRKVSDVNRLQLRIKGDKDAVKRKILALPGCKEVEELGQQEPGSCDFMAYTDLDQDIREPLFQAMADMNAPILTMRSMNLTLEDIFMQLTQEEGGSL